MVSILIIVIAFLFVEQCQMLLLQTLILSNLHLIDDKSIATIVFDHIPQHFVECGAEVCHCDQTVLLLPCNSGLLPPHVEIKSVVIKDAC